MSCIRFKDNNPFADVVKIWYDEEAQNLARKLWPDKDWTANVDLLELLGDGEFIINGDPFAKRLPSNLKY